MKNIFRTSIVLSLVFLLVFGLGGCYWYIEREQSALGIARAIYTRNGGDNRQWQYFEWSLDEITDGTLGNLDGELDGLDLVAKAVLIRMNPTRERTLVMAYIYEFGSEQDARTFIGNVNNNSLTVSETNVYRGNFAIAFLQYPIAGRPDGTVEIGLIRHSSNDVDNLAGKFRWAVRV